MTITEQQARTEYSKALRSGDREKIKATQTVYYSLVKAQWLKENKF